MPGQIRDSAGNPILAWSYGMQVGSLIAGSTTVLQFDVRGGVRKILTVKNVGTTALIQGSVYASHDGTLIQVIDGTSFTSLAAGAVANSKIEDPRGFIQFWGSTTVNNVINVHLSSSSF